ncbi:MAG: winged helix-turn-helix transcriptional regulator [Bdellovibrionaceae bacterium]|nr:winged helix-turn-helix transcriptional regulator [Pseudobdellovibrionaceae bacterium]
MKNKLQRLNEKEEVRSWRTIMAAYRSTYHLLGKSLLNDGCTIQRFQIFYNLYFEGAHRPSLIAKKLDVSLPNITSFVKRMMRDKQIIEDWSDGGKRPKYKLSESGEEFFEEIFPKHVKHITQLIDPIPPKLIVQLTKIKDNNEDKMNQKELL